MGENDESWLDADIRTLNLTSNEKAGLQIYRNYKRSFEDYALSNFRHSIDMEPINLDELKKLLIALSNENVILLPIMACGYADDTLKDAFKKIIPGDIPGGAAEMINGYGPLSDFSKRIRLAYAFDVFSKDLMVDIDKIRSIRNRIAHDWDFINQKDFYIRGRIAELAPIEGYLLDDADFSSVISKITDPSDIFRVRLIWILGRLTYEASAYHRAKEARLSPHRALYGSRTRWLADIAAACMDETRTIASRVSQPLKR